MSNNKLGQIGEEEYIYTTHSRVKDDFQLLVDTFSPPVSLNCAALSLYLLPMHLSLSRSTRELAAAAPRANLVARPEARLRCWPRGSGGNTWADLVTRRRASLRRGAPRRRVPMQPGDTGAMASSPMVAVARALQRSPPRRQQAPAVQDEDAG